MDASAGNRTRINCLEGSYADHYTTDAHMVQLKIFYSLLLPTHKIISFYLLLLALPVCSYTQQLTPAHTGSSPHTKCKQQSSSGDIAQW